MPASINDKLKKYKSLFSTTLSTGIGTGTSDTITPATVTGLPTDTAITLTIDRVDASGTATPSKMERIKGVVSSGNIINYVRAVDGTTEQAHTAGAVVEMVWNADDWNNAVDHLLVEHGQDGKHTKVNGNTVTAGTDTVALLTASQTLTNKTLTSPKINEDVALTATATQLNAQVLATNDGWTSADESWAYASASTITVPSGAAAKYSKGDKIKLTQSATVKYFYVKSVADTVLTVTGGSDYTVADATISANFYSHQSSPIGFPAYFNTTATTFNATYVDNGSGGTISTSTSRFTISGNICIWTYKTGEGYKVGTNNTFQLTIPSALPTSALSFTGCGGLGVLNVPYIHTESGYFFTDATVADNAYFNQLTGTVTYIF